MIQIRKIDPADYAAFAAVYQNIFPKKNVTEASVKKIFRDEPAQILLACDDKNCLVGFLYYWTLREELNVIDVGVVAECRRQGIAKMLFDFLVKEPRAQTVETITLEVSSVNTAAIELYKGLGFLQTGVRSAYYSDGSDAILMDLAV